MLRSSPSIGGLGYGSTEQIAAVEFAVGLTKKLRDGDPHVRNVETSALRAKVSRLRSLQGLPVQELQTLRTKSFVSWMDKDTPLAYKNSFTLLARLGHHFPRSVLHDTVPVLAHRWSRKAAPDQVPPRQAECTSTEGVHVRLV